MSNSQNLKIPLQEISSTTNGFAHENIIGEGGYGLVYLGHSQQHGLLAIKRLNRVQSLQGDHEYGMEVELLSNYKHENLVSLVGFCAEGGERILAYKYEANGSLDKVLHKKDLSWKCRLQICLGAARGLRYLHNYETGIKPQIIHRDIKSSNILLDENWKAKISDFGLSRLVLTKPVHSVYTAPCGTRGYIDPQIRSGRITQKSDVYSFGVVLFEVLFGKLVTVPPPVPDDRHFTVKLAQNLYETKTLDKLIDPDLRKQMKPDSLNMFSSIANECLQILRKDRPTMNRVVEALEKALGYQQGRTRESFGLSSSGFSHDVYISFRAESPSSIPNIVDNLCQALESEGLSTYKGSVQIPRKKSVLQEAIKQSRSFIIIFSKNFAASYWNLEEVAEIVKCVKERGNVVIPVFSDVDPSDVREQKGYFGEALFKFDGHSRMEVLKNALDEAANVPGGLQESKFWTTEALAKRVATRIKRNPPPLPISRKGC